MQIIETFFTSCTFGRKQLKPLFLRLHFHIGSFRVASFTSRAGVRIGDLRFDRRQGESVEHIGGVGFEWAEVPVFVPFRLGILEIAPVYAVQSVELGTLFC